jgi:hypothetical protein
MPTENEMAWSFDYMDAGISYGDFLSRLSGFREDMKEYELKSPVYGVAAAHFFQGLGIIDLSPSYKPKMKMIPSYCGRMDQDETYLLPFSCLWDEDGNLRSVDWDRPVFLASYSTDIESAQETLYKWMKTIEFWGHTYRRDIGSDWDGLDFEKFENKNIEAGPLRIEKVNLKEVIPECLFLEMSTNFRGAFVYDQLDFQYIAKKSRYVWMAFKEGYLLPVGMIILEARPKGFYIENVIANSIFGIDTKGIGKILIQTAENWALKQEEHPYNTHLSLHCNPELVDYYSNLGYAKTQKNKDGRYRMTKVMKG